AAIEDENDVIVLAVFRAGAKESAGSRGLAFFHAERPRHSQMRDQGLAAVQFEEKVFGATVHVDDAPPAEPLAEAGREGEADVFSPQFDLDDARAEHRG